MRKFLTLLDPVVPMHHPRVLVETAVAQGADRAAVLADTAISDAMLGSPEARVSYAQFGKLVNNALRLTGNPALGIDVGRNTRVPQMGVLGLAMLSSATLGDAMETVIRYSRALAPMWEIGMRIEGGRAVLRLQSAIRGPQLPFATEWVLATYDVIGRSLYGGVLPVQAVRFDYPRPAYAERYVELHDVPMAFDQPFTEVDFEAEVLATKLAHADPATAKLAEQFVAQQLPAALPPEGLVEQVRRRLGATRGPLPDVEQLARELQTSSRSLRRFLQQNGTSYQELAEDVRRTRALEWVSATDITFEQIASQLGFSDVRSFRRAFKRWTGSTPNAYRDASRGS